ncbi:hypothetical protein HF521_020866, partial [Silurus meridionalis]
FTSEFHLTMAIILHVIVHEKPADVDALKHVLQEKLQVSYSFNVQYEDPDFNHVLCNLSDINDLPERGKAENRLRLPPQVKLTQDLKHDILEALAGAMYTFKAYSRDEDFAQVAAALVKAHPCLTKPGSLTGAAGWKNSLKLKMANYRTKQRKCICSNVAVKRKRGATDNVQKKGIKKPRRFELNFLLNFPNGENEESQEHT